METVAIEPGTVDFADPGSAAVHDNENTSPPRSNVPI
jgi:hypothetical protein